MPSFSGAAPGLEVPDVFSAELLFVGVAFFAAIGALSQEEERPFSASIVYLGLGFAAAALVQLFDVGWLNPFGNSLFISHLTEVALIVALFASGLRITRSFTWRAWRGVALLIGVAMTLTIAAVAAYAGVVMGLSLGAAVALGAILAPTDPVLAGAVGLGAPGEQERRGDARFNLQAEASFNDALASPFVLLAIFILERSGAGWLDEWLLADVLYAAVLPIPIGGALGWGIARLAAEMRERKLLSPELDGFLVIGAVLVAYGVVDLLDMYGFLAVFAAGIGFRRYEVDREYNRRAHDGAQVAQNFLELGVILVLGSLVTFSALEEPGLAGWLLAPLLILLLRPLIVLGSLTGSRMPAREKAFIGLFGVKGVASIHFVTFLVEKEALSAPDEVTIFWTVAFAVMLSILVHGAAASPLSRRLLER